MKATASRQLILRSLILLTFGAGLATLGGCASNPTGGPVAAEDAIDAGLLTLSGGRSYPVYPADLAYTGEGRYRWPDGRTFNGRFVAGKPEGMGIGTWPGGDHYRGTWHDGQRHGHGELTRTDESRYVGDFINGRREGSGVEQSPDGLYRGGWQNDLPNGQGEFHGSDGATYSGLWVDGRRQGYGTYLDQRGNRYEGDWYGDEPDGFGIMKNVNGSVYEGEWRDSQQSGYGKVTTNAGVVYEGTWMEGRREGFGIALRPDGSRYDGEWANDHREGHGTESFADGSYHEGSWVAGQPRGTGTRKDRSGIEISGVWNGDYLDQGLMRLPTGNGYTGKLLAKRNTAVDTELLNWLEALIDDPWANFFLGTAYTDFSSPAPDLFKATGYFRKAAAGGIADGQFRLALLLEDKSPEQALEWLERAAAAGQAQANTLLGQYYLEGRRVQLDTPRAISYLQAGSRAGDMTARNNLAWVLATTERPELRDAATALALIRPLALIQGGWQHFDTLAAAYAALGEYEQAAEAQKHAIADGGLTLSEQSVELTAMHNRLIEYQQAINRDNTE